MKAWLCLAATVLFASGCNREADRPAAASAPASDVTRTADGAVIIPPDSPKMQQIRVEPVKEAEIPVDEVVSPGKIEVNPNRVSRVLLPVPGRISTVLVRIGDVVR
jgi:cobalt-zinc-cadmium efflux system membrane fusion protein